MKTERKKINITKLKRTSETLLFPLYCRALELDSSNPIMKDKKSKEIVTRIEYDFSKFPKDDISNIITVMRARKFDEYVNNFLNNHKGGVVLNIGCGLDSRFDRLDNGKIKWFDLDLPEVIEIKKKFYRENKRYNFISLSVLDFSWIEVVKEQTGKAFLFIAEGVFMYLKKDEVKKIIIKLNNVFENSILIFDICSPLIVQRSKKSQKDKEKNAFLQWGIKNSKSIEDWGKGIKLVEEWFFFAKKKRGLVGEIFTDFYHE